MERNTPEKGNQLVYFEEVITTADNVEVKTGVVPLTPMPGKDYLFVRNDFVENKKHPEKTKDPIKCWADLFERWGKILEQQGGNEPISEIITTNEKHELCFYAKNERITIKLTLNNE